MNIDITENTPIEDIFKQLINTEYKNNELLKNTLSTSVKEKVNKEESEAIKEFLDKNLNAMKILVNRILNSDLSESENQKFAYIIIQFCRELLTREKFIIRFYDTSDFSNTIIFKELSIFDLYSNITKNFKLSESMKNTNKVLVDEAEMFEKMIEKHWNELQNSITTVDKIQKQKHIYQDYKHPERLYIPIYSIRNKYKTKNPGLKQKPEKGGWYWQIFTKGHLVEAFDASITALLKSVSEDQINKIINNYSLLEKAYFGQFLQYDSVSGLQAGDVDLKQIKSTGASIVKAAKLKTYLQDIQKFLTDSNKINQNTINNFIEQHFKDQPVQLTKWIQQEINNLKLDNS